MMPMYRGPATLEQRESTHEVTVQLWHRPPRGIMLGEWGGTALGEGLAPGDAQLRLPDGGCGRVTIVGVEGSRATLKGAGDPPA